MARCSYEDEEGTELWTSDHAEYVPPGTLVTGPDGTRYLAVRVSATQTLGDADDAELRIALRLID